MNIQDRIINRNRKKQIVSDRFRSDQLDREINISWLCCKCKKWVVGLSCPNCKEEG